MAGQPELRGGLWGASEDGRVWGRAAGCKEGRRGGTQTAGISKDGGARGDKSEGDHRGLPGMFNDDRS